MRVCVVMAVVVFREITKPLIPLGQAGVLLVHILLILCKAMVSYLFFMGEKCFSE